MPGGIAQGTALKRLTGWTRHTGTVRFFLLPHQMENSEELLGAGFRCRTGVLQSDEPRKRPPQAGQRPAEAIPQGLEPCQMQMEEIPRKECGPHVGTRRGCTRTTHPVCWLFRSETLANLRVAVPNEANRCVGFGVPHRMRRAPPPAEGAFPSPTTVADQGGPARRSGPTRPHMKLRARHPGLPHAKAAYT